MLAFEAHQVFLADHRARIDIAAANDVGDQRADVEVVRADEAAVAHVRKLRLDRRDGVAAGDREQRLGRRAVAALVHRLRLRGRDVQQLVLVRHDHVAPQQVAELARLDRAGAHLRHRRVREAVAQKLEDVGIRVARARHLGRTPRDVGQTAAARDQPDTDFDQAHVALHRCNPPRRVQRDLAAAAKRDAADRGDHRHGRVAHAQHRVLQFLDLRQDAFAAALHEHRHHLLEVGAGREHVVRRPDHEALVLALGEFDGFRQAFDHALPDQVQLRGDAGDQHLAVERPDAHLVVPEHLGARAQRRRGACAEHRFAEDLALVHRQRARRDPARVRGTPRAFGMVDTAVRGDRAFEHPLRQRRCAQRLAGVDVFLDPAGDGRPACGLPQLERALADAEAPAHREVDVARALGDVGEVHGCVVEAVAQDRPQKLRLRVLRFAQQLQALGRRLLEDARDDLVGLAAARHVLAGRRVEAQNILAHLLVEARAGLRAERAAFDQHPEHLGRCVAREERVVGEVVLQCLDDVRHRVEPDHIRSAEGAARCTAELLAGQVVDHVIGEPEGLGFLDRREHAGDADAVGDEVWRVHRAHDALAQRGGDESFELIEDFGVCRRRVDQLDQRHVARRVEEVDAAEARLDGFGQRLRELRDRQPRGVARDDRVLCHGRRNLFVQRELPVHALGDGLDDQVAAREQVEVLFVVRLLYQRCIFNDAERRRLQLLQAFDSLRDDAVLRETGRQGPCPVFVLRRQIEQDHGHLAVDEVGGDLRAHDAGAEHGDLADWKVVHLRSFKSKIISGQR